MSVMDRDAAAQHVGLTVGALLFNWPRDKWRDFYARLADEAPVDVVCLGEVVCSKRTEISPDVIAETADRLQRGGKSVVLSTGALITLLRERKECAGIANNAHLECEINDFTALAYHRPGQRFRIGPLVNVYNEGTLQFLSGLGASSVCLPPELSLGAVESLAQAARGLDMGCEIWSFGRIPLAISGRCYHARIASRTKDSCRLVCLQDSDGLDVKTMDGKNFLSINGVQTLSHSYCCTVDDIDKLKAAGVTSLRLSPHSCDMVTISEIFRARLDGHMDADEAWSRIRNVCGPVGFTNGFLSGGAGAGPNH